MARDNQEDGNFSTKSVIFYVPNHMKIHGEVLVCEICVGEL